MKIWGKDGRPDRRTMLILSTACMATLVAGSSQAHRAGNGAESHVAERPWMNRALSPGERASLLLKQMTLDEKITMVHGVKPIPIKGYVGYVPANKRLGIPALTLADGRAAVGNGARAVTLLPAPIAAASGWDPEILYAYGQVLGEEQWAKGTNVALGPSIDVVRVPEWGRTFESYGEDPYFNGQMAVAEIKGIQSEGPLADANMYVTMNQESNRFKEDSRVDERTLQEIYLPPFAAAIKQGGVGTVMCAYVKTNGVYSCENRELLKEILRKQLKFDGWVMSDWGATHSTVEAANNGLDQEMPGDEFFGAKLKQAVMDGQVSRDVLDGHVQNILVPMLRQGLFDRSPKGTWSSNARSPEHDKFSRNVAEQGTVLLKNNGNILPLRSTLSVAVIGTAGSTSPKVEGGGSSAANAPYIVSPLEGIRKRVGSGAKVLAADGANRKEAIDLARKSDVAIVFAHTEETEGSDRPDLELPGKQDGLIAAVADANPRTIVVLDTGGPVLMPWESKVEAIIQAWYAGQEAGNAIAAILYGDVNPSAKLPLTFPRSAQAVPTSQKRQWPGIGGESIYSEGLNVGYRWYDKADVQPLFPFGFGLSYTTFNVSHLRVVSVAGGEGPVSAPADVQVTVDVTNTGKRAGAEVVQAYIADPPENGEPPHQLRGFAKVQLRPGETKTVNLKLDDKSFSVYDEASRGWVSRKGQYGILVGTSSRDLPLQGSINVR